MGMVIFFLLFLYVIAAVAVIALVRRFITTNRWVTAVLMTIALLLPTYDSIITNVLGAYYCSQEPNPKTLIKKKVEYPLSIYWEDNVYPGFSVEDRKLMITNYLDGVHLKTMALNGDDGTVYVYSRDVPKASYEQLSTQLRQEQERFNRLDKEFDRLYSNKEPQQLLAKVRDERLEAMKKVDSSQSQIRQLVDSYQVNEKIYAKQTMPKMNYTVTFNEIKLDPLSRKFLYADETKIIDNTTQEIIAYNRRYMRFFHHLRPDFVGGRYYYPHPICGIESLYYNGDGFRQIAFYGSNIHKIGLNTRLYNKDIKGEK